MRAQETVILLDLSRSRSGQSLDGEVLGNASDHLEFYDKSKLGYKSGCLDIQLFPDFSRFYYCPGSRKL